jgi:lipoprotein NlpD
MHTRNLTLAFCLLLSGCLTNDPGQVSVVDKSFNISNTDLSTKVIASDSNTGSWVWPVKAKILKDFSVKDKHLGLTFDTQAGQEVYAIRAGTVVYSGDKLKSLGKMIIIKHAFGFYSTYTQNQEYYVREGDHIEKGELIAKTGKKPFYFEMKKYSDTINPLKYLHE